MSVASRKHRRARGALASALVAAALVVLGTYFWFEREPRVGTTAAAEAARAPAADASAPAVVPEPDRGRSGALASGRALGERVRARASACIEHMHRRAPHAQGLLALTLRFVKDASGGIVIDDVSEAEDNEVEDAELFDCIVDGAFSAKTSDHPIEYSLRTMIEPRGH